MIGERQTSLHLEDVFWLALKDIATQEGTSLRQLVQRIDTNRQHPNLSSAMRLFVLDYYMTLAEQKTPQ
jgi:predicted DNA-binding ribbon-helix-helix protein